MRQHRRRWYGPCTNCPNTPKFNLVSALRYIPSLEKNSMQQTHRLTIRLNKCVISTTSVVKSSALILLVPFPPPNSGPDLTNFEVPITARQAIADDEFEGIKIPKASLIHFPALVINMNTEFWGEDAESFRPERWENLKDVPNTQFITFQHGTPVPPLSHQLRFRFDLLFVFSLFPFWEADSGEVSVHVSDGSSRN